MPFDRARMSRAPRRAPRHTLGDRCRVAGVYGSLERGRQRRFCLVRSRLDKLAVEPLASSFLVLELFDRLYSEFWELPGKIVLSDDDIIKVVYRLIAIGFHNVQAFAGFGADDIVALLLNLGYDMDIEVGEDYDERY